MQKEKLNENWKSQKSNKRSNLDHLFPGNGARKRDLLTVNSCIKVRLDLQEDKSPRSQGTLLRSNGEPKVSNPWNKYVTQKMI
jgi:hypothetical protein